ncbi:MAG: hypothetical protein ACOH2J_07630, partial [Allorhizobium sp.]
MCRLKQGFGGKIDAELIDAEHGGNAGKQYAVRVSSLPTQIQQKVKEHFRDAIDPKSLRIDQRGLAEHNWKVDLIRPILAQPKGSAERQAEYLRLAGTERVSWRGKPVKLALSTLKWWVQRYETYDGMQLCLAQIVRNDKGKQRVFISRTWEKAVPFDRNTREVIQNDLKMYVRALIKGGAQRKQGLILTAEKLKDMTAAYGFAINNPATAAKVFNIPLDFWREEYRFKGVYRHAKDRKASEDDSPRIRRAVEGLAPMECVVMDVHHINVLVRREDGTTATPKLLAFHDLGTYRVFCEVVLFEEGGGVRNTDVITAFVNMCQNPSFGVPQFLYADNGAEYGFADYLSDALKLGSKVIAFAGEDDRNRIIRAKPYNAAAKHVEGWFRQMNQQYFRHIQGWIDDDRMNPKRPTLGKLPAAFSAGFEALCATIYGHLTAYEHMPQKGALSGKSPAMKFREHVSTGWKATVMNPADLLTVFTKPETRFVRKHGIDLKGAVWTCDGLLRHFERQVLVHVPVYHGFSEVLVTDINGNEIGVAVADRPYDVLDARGAKESARRKSIRNKALTDLKKSVPTVDVGAALLDYGRKQLPVVPNEPDGVISVTRSTSSNRVILPVSPEKKNRQQAEDRERPANAFLAGRSAEAIG